MFTDGHDTGVYSWATLYELGINFEKNWHDYLSQTATEAVDGKGLKRLVINYFAVLVPRLNRDREEVLVPPSVVDVASLIEYLADRGPKWKAAVKDSSVVVTVNKQFAEATTPVHADDEIALVPQSPGNAQ